MINTHKDIQGKKRGLLRILYAVKYSFEGMQATFSTEPAFRQEIFISCISIPLAILMPISFLFKAFLIASTIAILITELLNSAIEGIVDILSQEYHPLVKRAKDMGSAAVMISIINLSVAWLFALLQAF